MSNLGDVLSLNPAVSGKGDGGNSSSKASKPSGYPKSEDSENLRSKDETESFLNSLLGSIDDNSGFSFDNALGADSKPYPEGRIKPEFSESEKLAIFESSSLMEILSLLEKLKIDGRDVKLGNLSARLLSLVKTEENLSILKGASTLSELLEFAKNLGLHIKSVKVEHLTQVLKDSFPNLDQAGFFRVSADSVSKDLVHNKIAQVMNGNFDKGSWVLKRKEDTTSLLTKTLRDLDFIVKDGGMKIKGKRNENAVLDLENNSKTFKARSSENLALKDSRGNLAGSEKSVILNKLSRENEANGGENLKDSKETKKEGITKEDKIRNSKTDEVNQKTQNLSFKGEEGKSLKSENAFKESLKEHGKQAAVFDSALKEQVQREGDIKESLKNIKENPKEREIRLGLDPKASGFENSNKTSFFKENKENVTLNNLSNRDSTPENSENLSLSQSDESNVNELNSLVKDLSKTSQNQVRSAIGTRETLQYFSQDLKEALEQYKAPITRFNITLNPSNLGEVEVILVQRGNHLHINFSSNTHAMNLFIQNQAEFKNSLVNMGFTGLEMNFSDQNKREQNSGQNKNRLNFREDLDGKDEPKVNLEIVLARYF